MRSRADAIEFDTADAADPAARTVGLVLPKSHPLARVSTASAARASAAASGILWHDVGNADSSGTLEGELARTYGNNATVAKPFADTSRSPAGDWHYVPGLSQPGPPAAAGTLPAPAGSTLLASQQVSANSAFCQQAQGAQDEAREAHSGRSSNNVQGSSSEHCVAWGSKLAAQTSPGPGSALARLCTQSSCDPIPLAGGDCTEAALPSPLTPCTSGALQRYASAAQAALDPLVVRGARPHLLLPRIESDSNLSNMWGSDLRNELALPLPPTRNEPTPPPSPPPAPRAHAGLTGAKAWQRLQRAMDPTGADFVLTLVVTFLFLVAYLGTRAWYLATGRSAAFGTNINVPYSWVVLVAEFGISLLGFYTRMFSWRRKLEFHGLSLPALRRVKHVRSLAPPWLSGTRACAHTLAVESIAHTRNTAPADAYQVLRCRPDCRGGPACSRDVAAHALTVHACR
jgi:hypothetical protein